MKILIAMETQEAAIQMCPVAQALKQRAECQVVVCASNPLQPLPDALLAFFDIAPDYTCLPQDGDTATIATQAFIQRVLDDERPDLVLLYGDTAQSFVIAWAAAARHIPIACMEGRLRTLNANALFPVSFGKNTATSLASLHLMSDADACKRLVRDGIAAEDVYETGDAMLDMLRLSREQACDDPLVQWVQDGKTILLSVHNQQSSQCLQEAYYAAMCYLEEEPDCQLLIASFDPQASQELQSVFRPHSRVRLCNQPSRLLYCQLLQRAHLILTDHRALQSAAAALRKPMLLLEDASALRNVGENAPLCAGRKEASIYASLRSLMSDALLYDRVSKTLQANGDGHTGQAIAEILCRRFASAPRPAVSYRRMLAGLMANRN